MMRNRIWGRRVFVAIMLVGCTCLPMQGMSKCTAMASTGQEDVVDTEVSVEYVNGAIGAYADGHITVNGTEFLLTGEEQCVDMIDNTVDVDELHVGDQVQITYKLDNMEIVSIRLDEKNRNNGESSSEESKTTGDGQGVIRLENGTYTN